MRTRNIAAFMTAAVMALCCTGCGDKQSKDKKHIKKLRPKTRTESIAEDEGGNDSIVTDDESETALTAVDGQYIMQAYDVLQSSQYSIKLTYTDPSGFDTDIYRVVDGSDYYELQTNEIGTSGCIATAGSAYDFDNVCGIFRRRTCGRPESLIETVVDQKLPATDTNVNTDASLEHEEYTYTGSSYIAVMDFYFDKVTGLPTKYTTRYMVEQENGDEGMTETRTIKEIKYGADGELVTTDGETEALDREVFDLSFISKLTDFDSMTAEQRLGYCQAIFVTAGVTAEEIARAGYNDEKLRNISYDDFTSLVYTYGYDL